MVPYLHTLGGSNKNKSSNRLQSIERSPWVCAYFTANFRFRVSTVKIKFGLWRFFNCPWKDLSMERFEDFVSIIIQHKVYLIPKLTLTKFLSATKVCTRITTHKVSLQKLRVGSSAQFQRFLVQILGLYFKHKMPLFGHKDRAPTFFVVIRPDSTTIYGFTSFL